MSAGPPEDPVEVPTAVAAIIDARPSRIVWRNEHGGLTFELLDEPRTFVKWTPATSEFDADRERARLQWAAAYTAVPRVLEHGRDDEGTWIVTLALPGHNAVDPRWIAEPARAVAAIGSGLRRFHDALPVVGCPFDWSNTDRIADARRRAAAGRIDPSRWHEQHRGLGLDEALARIATPPPVDRLVVCHGDTCAPNTLIDDDGRCCGHVDLGALGVADRWADLAIATWSTTWNYGDGWENALLDAYGIAPEPELTAYYRLLYELGP